MVCVTAPTVQYLDYGNTEAVDSGSVWDMEPEFAILPLQALKCSLAGVLPQGDAWPQGSLCFVVNKISWVSYLPVQNLPIT